MSKSKHTPGPWWVEVIQDSTMVTAKEWTIADDVSNNDADLIAAAPELLEALERYHEYVKCSQPIIYDDVTKLIKKAKGEF